MSSWAWSLQRRINSLLPFSIPGTPLYQDVVHTVVLCAVLYYLPIIAEKISNARTQSKAEEAGLQDGNPLHERHHVNANGHANLAQRQADGEHQLRDLMDPEEDHFDQPNDTRNDLPINHGHNAAAPPFDPEPPPPAQDIPVPEPIPAPAPAHQPPPRRPQRDNIGAKKAKSLARKEQRRAHFEFLREQAAHARALEQSTEAERLAEHAAAVAARKPQWEAAQRKLDEAAAKRKEGRLKREKAERERRIRCEAVVRERMREERCVDVQDVVEEVWEVEDEEGRSCEEMQRWVGNLVRAMPGVLGRKVVGGEDERVEVTMLTAAGFIVRVDAEIMDEVYRVVERMARERWKAGGAGKVSMEEMGQVLEQLLIEKSY